MTNSTRMVYGTRTNKWYEVNLTDRDYLHGIDLKSFKEMTHSEAVAVYLSSTRA